LQPGVFIQNQPGLPGFASSFPASFGLEQEHFILKNGAAPSPADVVELFTRLARRGLGVYERPTDGTAGVVALETRSGRLEIKTDGFTHVLEVAFPPLRYPSELLTLYNEVWGGIRQEIEPLGLALQMGGCLPDELVDRQSFPVSADSLERQRVLLTREMPHEPFSVDLLSAVMCATHVHLPAASPGVYGLLPFLYSYEYLIPLLFSTSHEFRGQTAHCVRPLMYRDSFTDSYPATAFPVQVPDSLDAHRALIAASHPFVRDYSFIVPRSFGTVEFRTACAQDSAQAALELTALYIAIWHLAQHGVMSAVANPCAHFYRVCELGLAGCVANVGEDIGRLKTVCEQLPAAWAVYAGQALARFQSR
jgi:hypothetical protein